MESSAVVEINETARKTPYAVSGIRILLSFAFFYTFMVSAVEIAIVLYAVAFVSDIVDGRLARKMNTKSLTSVEAYLDPVADFMLVIASFSAFVVRQWYPAWILGVLVFMFLFFVISSSRRRPCYDPVGKYYGAFLLTAIGVTLLLPHEAIFHGVLLLITAYTLGLIVYRTFFLWKEHIKHGCSS